VCCFNDDIQCTGAVILAGLHCALRVTGGKLIDQNILFLGAGSAGVGIANLIAFAMTLEGLNEDQARSRISLFNTKGLLESSRTDLHDFQQPYAHPHAPSRNFLAVIESIKPTTIIGVSTQGKAFTQQVVEAMAHLNERPIIFALSNPTDRAECTAEQAYRWSKGRALYAAGVAFPPVRFGNKILIPGQGNNMFIFPAIGLAVYATRAKRVTDEMFFAVARGLAEQVTQVELNAGLLYPPQTNILETEIANAVRVCEVIFERGLAQVDKPKNIRSWINEQLYTPNY
jgi:malate dehydrogenase (oxaloacetate-decarboxylating)(NADP+)